MRVDNNNIAQSRREHRSFAENFLCRFSVSTRMISALALLILSSCNTNTPESEITDSKMGNISSSLSLDSLYTQMNRDLKSELDYYLERHNVEDEGYEMVAAFANGKRHSENIDTIAITNIGRWKGKKRDGTAISRDSLGRITIGHWDNDTLTSGIRIDSTGTYIGAFKNGRPGVITDAKAEGHGAYIASSGHYFEGHWEKDQRQGFGLQLLENEVVTVLKTGHWRHRHLKISAWSWA